MRHGRPTCRCWVVLALRPHLLELEVEHLGHAVTAHELHAEVALGVDRKLQPHGLHPAGGAEDGYHVLQVELDRGGPPLLRHEVEEVPGAQREVDVGRLRLVDRSQRHLRGWHRFGWGSRRWPGH